MTDRVSFLAFFFFESLNYVELKLTFGMTFYFMIAKVGAKKEIQRARDLKVIQVIQKISSLPELDCIRVGVETENCFDLVKLRALSDLLDDPSKMDQYYDVFGNVDLKVNILFPRPENLTIYSNPLEIQ